MLTFHCGWTCFRGEWASDKHYWLSSVYNQALVSHFHSWREEHVRLQGFGNPLLCWPAIYSLTPSWHHVSTLLRPQHITSLVSVQISGTPLLYSLVFPHWKTRFSSPCFKQPPPSPEAQTFPHNVRNSMIMHLHYLCSYVEYNVRKPEWITCMLSQPVINNDKKTLCLWKPLHIWSLYKKRNKSEQLPHLIQLLQGVVNEPNHISKNNHEQHFVHGNLKAPPTRPIVQSISQYEH